MTTSIEKESPDQPIWNTDNEVLSKENHLASRVYRAAEILQQPLYFLCNNIAGRLWTILKPGVFGNYNFRIVEVVRRFFLGVFGTSYALSFATICALFTLFLNFTGDLLLGRHPYLCLTGRYTGDKKETCATFNMSTLLPTMTLNDGVENSNERLRLIAHQLHEFHFVCGQEVDGASARFLAHELKDHFKEFYTYLGKSNVPFLPSGLFFACKEKVLNITVIPFKGNVQKTIKRAAVIFELQDYCVVTTHLDVGDSEKAIQTRVLEIQQIKEAIAAACHKPVLLCGDFNEDRYKPSRAYKELTQHFVDCIKDRPGTTYTCTDQLKVERFGKASLPTHRSIDYITYPRDQNALQIECPAASPYSHLSDHSLVTGKIIFKN